MRASLVIMYGVSRKIGSPYWSAALLRGAARRRTVEPRLKPVRQIALAARVSSFAL
jgi:hypothetical protein